MNSNRDKSERSSELKTPYFVSGNPILGHPMDAQTRCKHYHSLRDIIAIKFNCCQQYYPCFECHEETADHPARVWRKVDWNIKAVLCGACGHEMTINEYLSSKNQCPSCRSAFNPNCSKHYQLYFEK